VEESLVKKKIIAVSLAVLLVASLFAGCASTGAQAGSGLKPIAAKDLKIGFVYVGTVGDMGYNFAHDQGRKALEEQLGVKTVFVENVPENSDCEKTIRDLVDQGCNVIYATSFGFGEWALKVAKDHPEVYFGHATGSETAENLSTYMGKVEEPRYLSGIAAGMKTQSKKIGYVAAMPIPEVIRGINAFTLGVKSVSPDTTVEVIWTNTWFDPALEKQAALELINKGCDVIAQHCDSTAPQLAAQEKGVFAVGYNSASYDAAPQAYLTAPLFNWSTFYLNDVKSIIDGTWKTREYWEGMQAGMVALDTLSPNCAEGTQEKVDEATKKLESGELKIFAGPLKDNTGAEKVAAGSAMTDDEIWNMSWFVEGVIGTIPQ
jgi:basic membrane protein A